MDQNISGKYKDLNCIFFIILLLFLLGQEKFHSLHAMTAAADLTCGEGERMTEGEREKNEEEPKLGWRP